MMRIGIDLGGTKIEGMVMDPNGRELMRERRPTPAAEGYPSILSAVVDLIHSLETGVGQQCLVGMGTPGALSRDTGLLKNSNTVCMNGQPLQRDLERMLERTIRLENDANCFALSEAMDGAAQGYGVVFGVIMGTGVGGGIVCSRQIHAGTHHIAGEWGHNTLVQDGRTCYCGKRGCVETYLSGPGLVQNYRAAKGTADGDAREVVQQALQADAAAELAVQQFLAAFGRALAMVINILDPDAVVLGGGLSNIDRLYGEGREQVSKHLFNAELRTPILRHCHGDSSGVRGAARLWPGRGD
jgi:fructokinase